MLGAGAAIAAMASLLWGGDAGAAENERLNSHVTATEQGRAKGRGGGGGELEQELPEGDSPGKGRALLAFGVECQIVGGGDVGQVWKRATEKKTPRDKIFGLKGQNEDTWKTREGKQLIVLTLLSFVFLI